MAQPAPTVQPPNDPPPETVSSDEESLRQMFPDLDHNAIHDCYVLCDRNLERTIEFLLGDATVPVTTGNAPQNAHDMDEQLARQLEQEELAAFAAPRQQERQPITVMPPTVTFNKGPPDAAASNEPSIQEQAMKFVETGKRTFNSIFEKVKEKLKEFDEPSPGSSSSSHQQAPNPAPSQQYYYAPSSSTSATTPPVSGARAVVGSSSYAPTPQPAPTGPTTTTSDHHHPSPPATSGHPVAIPSTAQPYSITEGAKPGPAFLDKRPTALVETPRPHPEEDLTENPFDDRNHS